MTDQAITSTPETPAGENVASFQDALIQQVILDAEGVVRSTIVSNVLQENAVAISSQAQWADLTSNIGRRKFADGVVQAFEPPETVPVPRVPQLYAAALFSVSNGDIAEIGVAGRFVSAIYADIGLYYLFFAEEQPDTAYLAKAYDDGARVSVIEKSTSYIAVQALDAAGNPVDPVEISIEIIRVY